jgi:L-arabinose transport system substrate-binding protein
MRKMLCTLAALFAVTLLGGADQAKIKIGFLVKQPEEPWFQTEWTFAQKAADADGFELIKIGVTDGGKVLAAIDDLGTVGASGFVICTPDPRLGPAIVAKAQQNHDGGRSIRGRQRQHHDHRAAPGHEPA